MTACPVCRGEDVASVARIDFGSWGGDGPALERRTEWFDLGRCSACGHVMVTTPYTADTLRRIYLDTPQDPVFWDEALVGSTAPYEGMAAFCGPRVAGPGGLLADVGCGPGLLLAALERAGQPHERLVGIDFNRRLPEPYRFVAADLNRLDEAPDLGAPIAVAFLSHVLEHLTDPGGALAALARRLAPDGLVYVEVPDNAHWDPAIVGPANLVNQQHVHYFAEASLIRLAAAAGLVPVRVERSVLGYIPRLRVLLRRGPPPAATDPGPAGGRGVAADVAVRDVVVRTLALLAERRAALADRLCGETDAGRPVGLWGIGADFHRLVTERPDAAERVADGRIALFDLGLAGRTWSGRPVLPPSAIAGFPGTVYLAPLLGDVRLTMRRWAAAQGFPPGRVVDPFGAARHSR